MKNPILIYSKRERWGILSLAMLNLVLLLISYLHITPTYEFDDGQFAAFQKSVNDQYKENTQTQELISVDSLYAFNPNELGYDELLALGFSNRVAKNIINYRSKGGQFYNAQSVQKIYGMDSLFFEKIKPYIDIPQKKWAKKYPSKQKFAKAKRKPASFPFDPNTASADQLQALGFSKRVTNNIVNYRKKGGRFYEPAALKKVYGMTPEFYESILPNIQISKSQFVDNQLDSSAKPKNTDNKKYGQAPKSTWPKNKKLAINTATIEDWDQLPGVGQYFAKNIVRHRDKLGGFYATEQVAEAYRLPDSTFQRIAPFLIVDDTKLQQFNPQTADFKTINSHPYITYEQTKYIMKAQKGIRLMAKEDFLTVKIFTEEELERVLPYFLFE